MIERRVFVCGALAMLAVPRIGKAEQTRMYRVGVLHATGRRSTVEDLLEKRLGRLHARLRLGIEADHEAQVFGQGVNYFHIENFTSAHFVIRACLRLTGLYDRGCRNAAQIQVKRNHVKSTKIPKAFDGYIILQLSDLHVDMSQNAMARLGSILREIDYDLCVLTGDYRSELWAV